MIREVGLKDSLHSIECQGVMMLTDQIADLIKVARKALGLTQKELASSAGVSHRLWAEFERGERPNVSLETALRMLGQVGITVRMTDAMGGSRELDAPGAALVGRAARAAARRATWRGRQLRLDQEGENDPASLTGAGRIAAVTLVSKQAFALAGARPPSMVSSRRPQADTR